MKLNIRYICILTIIHLQYLAQYKNPYGVNTTIPIEFKRSHNDPRKYEYNNEDNFAFIFLLDDSTFSYYDYNKYLSNNLRFTVGRLIRENNFIFLESDSMLTRKIIKENSTADKYFSSEIAPYIAKGQFFRITDTKFFVDNKRKKFIRQPLSKCKKVQLFFFSNDVFSNGYIVDSIRFPYGMYSDGFNRLIIKTHTKQKKISFRLDSLWGWRYCFPPGRPRDYSFLSRLKGVGFPGLLVVQFDNIIIYEGGSKLRIMYFSKDPNSEILALSIKNLKKVYKENTKFTELLSQMKKLDSYYYKDHSRHYYIVDLYNKCNE
ncbi:MAG: hypothetical protein ACXVC7_11075 [Bacteroidia bacterium]